MAKLTDGWKSITSALTGNAGTKADMFYRFTDSALAKGTEGIMGKARVVGGALADAALLLPRAVMRIPAVGVETSARMSGWGFKQGVGAAVHFAKQPVVGAMKFTAGGIRLAKGHPLIAGAAVAGTGLMAWNHHEHSKAIAATQDSFVAAATGAPQAGNYNYMNSVSPEESAALQALQQQAPASGAGFAAAQQARTANTEAPSSNAATVPSI